MSDTKIIKNVTPMDLVEHLSRWTDRIAGHTVGLPPVTFRFLTNKNNYVMITADYATGDIYSKDSEISVSEYSSEYSGDIIDDLMETYYNSIEDRKKAETTAAKHRAERSKRNKKLA